MKKLLLIVSALISAAAVQAADAPPLFNALITMGKDTRFVLVSPAGKTSDWIHLGDTFEGYTLKNFNPATSTLEVEHAGAITKLALVDDATVKSGPATAPATNATLADAENVLQAMRFEDMMEKMLGQQKKQTLAMIKQMSSRMDTPGVDKDELAAHQQKMIEEIMSFMNAGEIKKDMARIYTDVFTKEELAGQTAFYMTPTGRAMVDKTPEVQAKLQAVLMPRMQAMMPRIMEMSQQFQQQQKAKIAAAKAAAASAGGAPAAPAPAAAAATPTK